MSKSHNSSNEDPEIDFFDPDIQDAAENRAILDMLRKLTDQYQPLPDETTDLTWTAFRALAKAGAAEGIIRSTCTYTDAASPSTEYYEVTGDYPSAMHTRPFLRTEPSEYVLCQARLTTTGIRFASYLKAKSNQAPAAVCGRVLHLLWEADTVTGRATRVPDHVGQRPMTQPAQTDKTPPAAESPAGEPDPTKQQQPASPASDAQLNSIEEMLRRLCTGALLQVGHTDLTPTQAREHFDALPPSRRKAWMEYFRAEELLGACTDKDAYEFIQGRLEPGEELPSFDTWRRYVREARKALGLQKYSSGKGKPTGKSVISPDDVEPGYYSGK